MNETIFALASGAPPAAIAVVRISGPGAFAAIELVTGSLPPPRRASLRRVRDPATGLVLDRAIVQCFPGPMTATGEDLGELHLHGGRAVVHAVLAALGAIQGLRAAEAGEFTRRAFEHGRIDLAEAEGLGDLLGAETERQRRSAMAAVEGQLSRLVADWTAILLQVSAQVEASLDFSDEDDVGEGLDPSLGVSLSKLASAMLAVLSVPPVERLRDGVRIVLAGPRNAGKSTLLNALVEREAAIVSPIAGTTRDVIEIPVQRNGIAYIFSDTAGMVEHTADPVEAIGVERARATVSTADILLWLDDDEPPPPQSRAIWLYPRADIRSVQTGDHRLAVSGVTRIGLDALWSAVEALAEGLLPRADQVTLNLRQRGLCAECRGAVLQAAQERDPILMAEQLRLARRALDRITGRVDVEAMLDTLFGRFCIGK